jgi:protein TonB
MAENFKDILDFDDLVFENRNREYGAYQLRKKYKSAIITAIVVASLLTVLVVVVPFVLSSRPENLLSERVLYYSMQMGDLELPIDDIFIPPPPPPPPPPISMEIIRETVRYAPPIIVDTILPSEENFATIDEVLLQTTEEYSDLDGFISGIGDGVSYGFGEIGGIEPDEPFVFVETMPSFRGGDINTFREWVQRRTTYPQAAIDARIRGRVYLTFIVETDGSVSNVTVVQGVAPIIDNEAVMAIQSSPRWSPGLQRGQPVRVRFSMWLNFTF